MRRYSKIINSMNIKKLFCLWMLCNVCLFGAAADALPSLFQFRHYNIENGMSSNTVYDILQDAEGYIWIGTDNGLNRFDVLIPFLVFARGETVCGWAPIVAYTFSSGSRSESSLSVQQRQIALAPSGVGLLKSSATHKAMSG